MHFLKKNYQPILEVVYVSVVATVLWAGAMIFFKIPLDYILLFSCSNISLGIYLLNRFTDKEDCINNIDRTTFFKNRGYLLFVSILLLVGSLVLLFLTKKITIYHYITVAIGICYSVKMIPIFTKEGHIEFLRIKDFWFLKSFTTAVLWGTMCFVILWSIYPSYINPATVLVLMISCTLGAFININFADMRDVAGDMLSGIKTIPIVFGKRSTLLYWMLLPSILWLVAIQLMFFNHILSAKTWGFLMVIAFFPALYIGGYHFKIFNAKNTTTLADSCFALFGIGLMLM